MSVGLPRSPYKGLAPFADTQLDAMLFFGRERDADIVAANVVASRLTVLYGPSGVGKSSLIAAAVARRLRTLPEQPVVVVFSTWSDDPAAALAVAVAAEAGTSPGPTLAATVESACGGRGDVYLLLDQAEEYFLYHPSGGTLEPALAEVLRGTARVNVLLSLREDALAKLDRFKASVPGILDNYLRLDRLSPEAARAAMVGPLGRFAELGGEQVEIEPTLVEAVLDQVAAGQIRGGLGGTGQVEGAGRDVRIEAPYLQLVLERLWEVEHEEGSSTLRAATLERLGGAARIVADHLERALAALPAGRREIASRLFRQLVTPSGTKIAYAAADLVGYADAPARDVHAVLDALAERRILRPGDDGTYEIYHDVLAEPVLDWCSRHRQARALATAHRRSRRMGVVAVASLLAAALMTAVTIWAFVERGNARQQTAVARQAQQDADRQAGLARVQGQNAKRQAAAATAAEQEADEQAAIAERRAAEASAAKREADRQKAIAEQESLKAASHARAATLAQRTAERQRAIAEEQRESATAAKQDAQEKAALLEKQKQEADRQATRARARERLATSESLLATDPEASIQAAIDSAALEPSSAVEDVLRRALLASRVVDILPGGGGPLVNASFVAPAGSPRAAAAAAARPGSVRERVVTAASEGQIRLYDSRTGALVRVIRGPGRLSAAAVSPAGGLVAAGYADGAVRLWGLAAGGLVHSLDHGGSVTSVAFSPDGRLLASTSTNQTVRVWDVVSGAMTRRVVLPHAVRSASFSPDGTELLIVATDRLARVYQVATGLESLTFEQPGSIRSATFSPAGDRVVTTGRDASPRLWDVRSGARVAELQGHTSTVSAAAFAPAGDHLVTVGTDDTGRIWDASSGRLEAILLGHTNDVVAVGYSPDGRHIVTASRDGTARVWEAATGRTEHVLLGHEGRVLGASFSGDGRRVVTASEDGTARTWDMGPELSPVDWEDSPVTAVAVSRDGSFAAAAHASGNVSIRRIGGRQVGTVRHDRVTSVDIASDGKTLLTSGADGTVRLWAIADGSLVRSFAHAAAVDAAVLDRTATHVVSADARGLVRIWDARSGRLLGEVREDGPVVDVAISSDGHLLATASGRFARIRRVVDRSLVKAFGGHRDAVTSVDFSPDGSMLLTASRDHEARLWSIRPGRLVKTLSGHAGAITSASFSADGRWVGTAGPATAGIWEVGSSTLVDSRLYFVGGHVRPLTDLAFAGTGWRLVTGSLDGTVRFADCVLCGTTDRLLGVAALELGRLEHDRER